MKRSAPALKLRNLPVTPLDIDDDALDRVIDGLRMPQLMAPEAEPVAPAAAAGAVPAPQVPPAPEALQEEATAHQEEPVFEPLKTDTERLTVEIPLYVGDQIRRRAFENRYSTRYIILSALKANGFDVKTEDLNPNRRRFKLSRS
jgi:hypothetical protein